jgi:hypothetical protein
MAHWTPRTTRGPGCERAWARKSATEATNEDDPTGWKTAMALKGRIRAEPPDAAENHDKYLYGSPEE